MRLSFSSICTKICEEPKTLLLYRCFEPNYQSIISDCQDLIGNPQKTLYAIVRKNKYIFKFCLKKRIGKIVRRFKVYN